MARNPYVLDENPSILASEETDENSEEIYGNQCQIHYSYNTNRKSTHLWKTGFQAEMSIAARRDTFSKIDCASGKSFKDSPRQWQIF
jgi:hypothetical protein